MQHHTLGLLAMALRLPAGSEFLVPQVCAERVSGVEEPGDFYTEWLAQKSLQERGVVRMGQHALHCSTDGAGCGWVAC